MPEHFSNKYEHFVFPGRQPTHWFRFRLLTYERYLLQMAQFIPHGAISSSEIELISFILWRLTYKLTCRPPECPAISAAQPLAVKLSTWLEALYVDFTL